VAESVAAALEGSVRLLVFDNCEHVRDHLVLLEPGQSLCRVATAVVMPARFR
jgi:hypothetical protein